MRILARSRDTSTTMRPEARRCPLRRTKRRGPGMREVRHRCFVASYCRDSAAVPPSSRETRGRMQRCGAPGRPSGDTRTPDGVGRPIRGDQRRSVGIRGVALVVPLRPTCATNGRPRRRRGRRTEGAAIGFSARSRAPLHRLEEARLHLRSGRCSRSLGVALGVAALATVMSVTGGFPGAVPREGARRERARARPQVLERLSASTATS